MSERIVILGATSGIARALCHALGKRGCRLVLTGRDSEELDKIAADCRVRYQTEVFVELFYALEFTKHAAFVARCMEHVRGDIDGVILCYGYMTDQTKTQMDFTESQRTLDLNFTSPVSLLTLFANYFEQRRTGYIAVISSVAGDRGRQSNYTYGAAKAGLSTYLQGLRNRLHRVNVHVLTIKPGPVDTPMTNGLIAQHSRLLASADRVAQDIDRAIRKRVDVLYTPWFWRPIMGILRGIPEPIFKRLSL